MHLSHKKKNPKQRENRLPLTPDLKDLQVINSLLIVWEWFF